MKRQNLLFLSLLLSLVSSVKAQDIRAKNADGIEISYNIISEIDLTCKVSEDYRGDSYCYKGDVKIPSKVEYNGTTYTVIAIGEHAFRNSKYLKTVFIPNSVTKIYDNAFENCPILTSVDLGDSISSIGRFAFAQCYKLPNIKLPETLRTIDCCAFSECRSLTSIEIPNSVTNIEPGAFCDCWKLEKIKLSNSITILSDELFQSCFNLKSVEIPNSVTKIGKGVFRFCTKIKSIEIPNTVTEIGGSAFHDCENLISANIPNGVTEIKNSTFAQCFSLETVNIPNTVTKICGSAFYICPNLRSIVVPNSVTEIEDGAFQDSGLQRIVLGKSVSHIGGKYTFNQCPITKLVSLNPNPPSCLDQLFSDDTKTFSILKVPAEAVNDYKHGYAWRFFKNIQALTAEEIAEIEAELLGDDFSFTSQVEGNTYKFRGNGTCEITCGEPDKNGMVKIPSSVSYKDKTYSVTAIADSAFYKNNWLKKVEIPETLTRIGEYAFFGCQNLHIVSDIPNSVKAIEKCAFAGCGDIYTLSIGEGVTAIGDSAFYNCQLLKSFEHPATLESIGDCAFEKCTGFSSLAIGKSVKTIGRRAYYGCNHLKTIDFGSSVVEIGDSAFMNCSKLTEINLPETITKLGYRALYGNSKIEAFYGKFASEDNKCLIIDGVLKYFAKIGVASYCIPDYVTKIDNGVFSSSPDLTSIEIPNSVIEIGSNAFQACTKLTTVTLGNSVEKIGEKAFGSCRKLEAFYGKYSSDDNRCLIINGVLSYFAEAGLSSYRIPDTATKIGDNVFSYCYSLTSIEIPNSVDEIGESVLIGCKNLEAIKGKFASEDNRCLVYNGILKAFAPSGLTEYKIPVTVTEIGNNALAEIGFNLTSLEIPNTVTVIGEYALSYLEKLQYLRIPDSVVKLGYRALCGSYFTTVVLGSSLKEIDTYAFVKCDEIEEIISLNPTPPYLNEKENEPVFMYSDIEKAVLKVPEQALKDYMTADGWKNFKNIVGLTEKEIEAYTGIEDVYDDADQRPAVNLQGLPVGKDYRGIVIQNGKKILRK